MKINRGDINRSYNTAINDSNAAADMNKKGGNKSASSVDKVIISDKAKDFSPEKNIASSVIKNVTGSTSSAKLLKLRDAVSSGNYNISSEDIANSIIGDKVN